MEKKKQNLNVASFANNANKQYMSRKQERMEYIKGSLFFLGLLLVVGLLEGLWA